MENQCKIGGEASCKRNVKSGLFLTRDDSQLGNHIKITLSDPPKVTVSKISFKL